MTYPLPPWSMAGQALLVPVVVDTSKIELPEGLEPLPRVGRTSIGLLAYVEYLAPSPLLYKELAWMPCIVRDRRSGARGYFVARMYVDLESSMRAGRELWGLPKTLASFDVETRGRSHRVRVDADGTRIDFSFSSTRWTTRRRSHITTIQRPSDGAVRFRGKMVADSAPAIMRLHHFESNHPGWSAFAPNKLPHVGIRLTDFRSEMLAPERLWSDRTSIYPRP